MYSARILSQRNRPLTKYPRWDIVYFLVAYQTIKHLICPSNWRTLHRSSQEWFAIAIGQTCSNTLQQVGCLDYTHGKKVPLGERGRTSLDSTTFKEWWGATRCRPLLVLCPATQRDQWVGCRHSMVMESCCGFSVSQPVGRTQNAIMLAHSVGHLVKHFVLHFLKW